MTDSDMASTGIAVTAADLIAHWWSRPVWDEVSTWIEAAPAVARVCERLTGARPSPILACSLGQVPDLLDEYERMFVGPGHLPCPPYESFWRDDVPIDLWHSLMGPAAADLRQLYRELGVDMAEDAAELPDHVAVEFEALAYALSRADGGRLAERLIGEHLGKWLPRFCKQVAEQARHPFYGKLAATTLDWFSHIQRMLDVADGDAVAAQADARQPASGPSG